MTKMHFNFMCVIIKCHIRVNTNNYNIPKHPKCINGLKNLKIFELNLKFVLQKFCAFVQKSLKDRKKARQNTLMEKAGF